MSNRTQAMSAMQSAMTILKGMGAQSHSSRLGSVGERVKRLFQTLDGMLTELPDDTPDDVLGEVERVVDTLHTVDQSWPGSGDAEAARLLDLAASRLRRIAQMLSS